MTPPLMDSDLKNYCSTLNLEVSKVICFCCGSFFVLKMYYFVDNSFSEGCAGDPSYRTLEINLLII